jgi:hypothetical protein
MQRLLQRRMHVHPLYTREGARVGAERAEEACMNVVHTGWRKSGRSNPSGNCVEVATLSGATVAIRDSKDPAGPRLVWRRAEFRAFLARIKDEG